MTIGTIKKVYLNPNKALRTLGVCVLLDGTTFLSNSRTNPEYGVSNREMFGLWVIQQLRQHLEPNKQWFISTDYEPSDDGIIGILEKESGKYKAPYIETIEQLYLSGAYLNRKPDDSATQYLLRHSLAKKAKGLSYEINQSLFILSDVNSGEYFYWAEFAKEFFIKTKFLHLYLLTLLEHSRNPMRNKYHLISFTDQVHRQKLNGEFPFSLTKNGIEDFKLENDLTKALEGLPVISKD